MSSRKNSIMIFTEGCLFILLLLIISGLTNRVLAQAEIRIEWESTICEGTRTKLEIIIDASSPPYTVIYTNGTSNFTVTNYFSDADPESPTYGGDAITVSPIVTTQY